MTRAITSVPVRRKIMVVSSILIVLITLIYTAALVFTGLLSRLTDSAYKALYYPVENRSDEIGTEMRLMALKANEMAEKLNSKIKSHLKRNGMDAGSIQDKKTIDFILKSAFPEMLQSTRMMSISGVFLILDASIYNDGIHKAGIRIKDSEPEVINDTNADLMYSRGPTDIIKDSRLAMDSFWSYEYDFSKDPEGIREASELDFFWKPYKEAGKKSVLGYENMGYWSRPYRLHNNENKVISYSSFLLDDNGRPYGVFGIDLSEDYLAKKAPAKEISYKNSFYFVGAFDEEKAVLDISWYMKSGNASSRFVSLVDKEVAFEPMKDFEKYRIYKTYINDSYFKSLLAKPKQLNLYGSNSPFYEEKWYLIGFAPEKEVRSAVNSTIITLFISILLTLVLGLAVFVYSTSKYTKKLVDMAESVKSHDYSNPITLKRVGITEIDDLTAALEVAVTEVITSGERLSLTMDLVNAQIGCFECRPDIKRVFLTDSLFRMLEVCKTHENDNFIPMDVWERIAGGKWEQSEFQYITPHTHTVKWLRMKTALNEKKILGIIMDITNEIYEKKRLEKERDYDVLTGLYNRRAFQTLVSDILLDEPETVGALIFLDLDNLKYINDVYGHDIGDKYIKCAADNVRHFQGAKSVLARISGDEFAVFVYGFISKEQVRSLVHEKIKGFNSSLRLPDNSVQKVRTSIGISYYPYDSDNFNDLMKFADYAMYEVKHSHKGSIKEFDRASYEMNYYLLDKSEAFNEMVEKKLVYFDFQPIVDVSTASVIGYEALMRPKCKDFKTPYEVLSIARTHAKLYEIEKLTVFKVLEYVRKYSEDLKGKKIFFNSISNQSLSDEDIQEIKENYVNLLSSVVVELTEGEKISKKIKDAMIKLFLENGARLAIDDFGSGYSNENALITVAPDYVKIDMSLVRDIDRDAHKQRLVANIIEYARSSSIKTIAEGVESFEEMKTLITLKVDCLQGFYLGSPFSKPYDISDNIKDEITGYSVNS